ncbi:hypothetical protein ACFQS6_13175 [Xanthomonas populi]
MEISSKVWGAPLDGASADADALDTATGALRGGIVLVQAASSASAVAANTKRGSIITPAYGVAMTSRSQRTLVAES